MNTRDKAIIAGLYLSKYNNQALNMFGFKTFQEYFNVLGFSMDSKPNSIKNYRDEFDPYFPNNRLGRHKREIRDYCKTFLNLYKDFSFYEFSELIKSFLIENYEIQKFIESKIKLDTSEQVSKRILTGKAAEEYFKLTYSKIDYFNSFNLQDTTDMACGFDYKLTKQNDFFCVEVKGLNDKKGSILLTEKEYCIAEKMKSNYCLFVVKNFKEKPFHEVFFDPLNSNLKFKETKREIIQLSYNTYL